MEVYLKLVFLLHLRFPILADGFLSTRLAISFSFFSAVFFSVGGTFIKKLLPFILLLEELKRED